MEFSSGLALQQCFNSHKPCYLFRYFPATLEGSSILVPSADEGAEIVKDPHHHLVSHHAVDWTVCLCGCMLAGFQPLTSLF